ncbi:DUF2993 domain-containing protein [Actinoplanes sp. NPDC051861]|uniref:LmeA family phospholipid-binding protein n=1 Tax=Actinoplanes sp. NPDC051861 TaxID=3155170 RepID=UPI0034483BBE
MAEVYETDRPRRHRGRALLVVLLVLVVLLLAGLFVLDRFGASYAERVLADRVAQEVRNQKSSSGQPEVTIAGVPFLTQVLAGKYQEIRIELPDLTTPTGTGTTVSMPLLDIRAKDVDAPIDTLRTGQGDVVAGSVTGVGTVDYTQIVELSGQKGLQLAEQDGRLVATVPLSAAGQTIQVKGTADIKVDDGVVKARFADVSAEGLTNIFVKQMISNLAANLGFDLKVPDLPMGLEVREVQVLPEGLRVSAGAEKVTLSAGGI